MRVHGQIKFSKCKSSFIVSIIQHYMRFSAWFCCIYVSWFFHHYICFNFCTLSIWMLYHRLIFNFQQQKNPSISLLLITMPGSWSFSLCSIKPQTITCNISNFFKDLSPNNSALLSCRVKWESQVWTFSSSREFFRCLTISGMQLLVIAVSFKSK